MDEDTVGAGRLPGIVWAGQLLDLFVQLSVRAGGLPGPTEKRARKRRRVGVAEHVGNLGECKPGTPQKQQRPLPQHLIAQRPVAQAGRLQVSPQGPRRHAQRARARQENGRPRAGPKARRGRGPQGHPGSGAAQACPGTG